MTDADFPQESLRVARRLRRANQIAAAMRSYEHIVARWPGTADAWYELGLLQRRTRNVSAAMVSYGRALAAEIAHPEEVHVSRALLYSDFLGDYASAEAELQRALQREPACRAALLNLANLYEDLGRRAEARSAYENLLAQHPHDHEALSRFANMHVESGGNDALIARLENALSVGASSADRASLGFALGRLLDLDGHYHRAFATYTAANRASLASVDASFEPYSRAGHEAFVDRLVGDPPASSDSLAEGHATGAPPRPLFIVGMFRSGSTLTEQLLAGLPGIAAAGEMDFLPRLIGEELQPYTESLRALTSARAQALAARYRAELAQVSASAQFVTDKRPDNFLHIGLIKRLFPDAKIIHTTRNVLDNCLAIYFLHLDHRMSYALNLADIGHYFRQYRRLMAFWKSRFPDIYDFDYDQLVCQPEAAFRGLCNFVGCRWDGGLPSVAGRTTTIKTASVWQARQPLYRSSSGRSRHYHAELQVLREYLADLL